MKTCIDHQGKREVWIGGRVGRPKLHASIFADCGRDTNELRTVFVRPRNILGRLEKVISK